MYSERVINNTSKDSLGSTNWKSDWAKFKNKSYASVVKQNISKKLGDENKSVMIHNISHFSEKYSQNYKAQWSNVLNDRASVAAQFDIFLKTVHIMGVVNEIADSLSRWAISDLFKRKFYMLMPDHLWVTPSRDVLNINWCI